MEPSKKIEANDMSEAEEKAVFGEPEEPVDEVTEQDEETDDEKPKTAQERIAAKASAEPIEGLPEFASLPKGYEIPPGKRCGWMLFRAEWTDAPAKGDRWVMMWPLSVAEEKMAYKRSQGDSTQAVNELAKATIRLIDGHKADRTGTVCPGSVNIFWAEIGTKLRQMIQSYYLKTHQLSLEEQQDFFSNCFVVTNAAVG
jgi:hypothetical protein